MSGTSAPTPTTTTYISIPEAAQIVRVSEATIRRLLTQRKLVRYKFGARTLLKVSELLALVQPQAGR